MPTKWYQEIMDRYHPDPEAQFQLAPFSLRDATEGQKDALRGLAQQAGFKDLRGFWAWARSAELTYYDLIKVASPE